MQGMMIHMSWSTDFRLRQVLQVNKFGSGTFEGSYYCSNLKFCMMIYTFKYNKNTQESGHNGPYVMVLTSDSG